MNKDILKGHWRELKGKIKQHWGKLTDDEITRVEGKADELSGLLQKKYGLSKERAEKDIESFTVEEEKRFKDKESRH